MMPLFFSEESLLLPYQARFVQDASRIIFAEKSRRIGITWAEAANSTLYAAASGRAGCDTWYLAANEDGAKEFMLDCAFWAKQYNLVCSEMDQVILDENKDILSYQIKFNSGWRVTGLTSRPTNLRGKQGRVVADEFAFHPDPEGLEKAAMALLMWGGQVIFISTHNGVNNYFNVLLEQVRAGKKKGSIHRVTLDDALADGLYRRICLVTGEPWSRELEAAWREEIVLSYGENADEELFCIPKSSSEVYIPAGLVEARMRQTYPVFRLAVPNEFSEKPEMERRNFVQAWFEERISPALKAIPEQFRSYYGMDFGRVTDASVISPLVERVNLTRYVPFVIELRNIPIRQQEQILWWMIDGLPRFSSGVMDANGNGFAIAESTKHRYGESRIVYMNASQEKYKELFPRYKRALEDNVLELPADVDILADHAALKLVNGVPKIPKGLRYRGSDGNWRHGDSAVSLAFGWWAATEHPQTANTSQPMALPTGMVTRNDAREIFAAAAKIPQTSRQAARSLWT